MKLPQESVKRVLLAVALVVLPPASVAAQQTITFDDYTSLPAIPIVDGYAGLNWSNFYVVNVLDFPIYGEAVSYPYVGINAPREQTASISARTTPFTLNSGYFSFRRDQFTFITAIGYVGGTPTFSTLVVGRFVEFNWENLSQVSFVALNPGAQFTVDDLTITEQTSTVPEPASVALFATGLLGLVPILRRKLRK